MYYVNRSRKRSSIYNYIYYLKKVEIMKLYSSMLTVLMFLGTATLISADWDTNIADTNIVDNGDGTYSVKKSWLLAQEMAMTTDPLYEEVRATIRTLPNDEVEMIVPGRKDNPSNVKRVERILTEEKWDYITPVKAPEYSYTKFLRAVGKFPAFCGDYSDGRNADSIALKSIATAFAHFCQETGAHDKYMESNDGIEQWRQALYYVREVGYEEGMTGYNSECPVDAWMQEKWPCGKDAEGNYLGYFGRGAKQLSYNFNYGPFSEAIYGDVNVLLKNPSLVADTWLNLASAIFFFVYPQPPKPSMLHVIDGTWQPNAADSAAGITKGFGVTINVINGGIECGAGAEGKGQPLNRIAYYKKFAEYFGVEITPDEQLGCIDQGPFTKEGSGAMLIQWENDWSYSASKPNGNFACQLVGYQTMHSALVDGDYIGCVERYYGDKMVIIDDIGDVAISKGEVVSKGKSGSGIFLNKNPIPISEGDATITVIPTTPSLVQLVVFDALGNLIDIQKTPSFVSKGAKFHWNLTNRSGEKVGSGTYVIYATTQSEDGIIERYKTILGVKR